MLMTNRGLPIALIFILQHVHLAQMILAQPDPDLAPTQESPICAGGCLVQPTGQSPLTLESEGSVLSHTHSIMSPGGTKQILPGHRISWGYFESWQMGSVAIRAC